MRLRDIVRGSFDHLIAAGALPHYTRLDRPRPAAVRTSAAISRPGAPAVGLYADLAAWRQAVAFIGAFTAASAATVRAQWQIPAWSGSFGAMPAEDLLHHLAAGLGGCGLRPLSSNRATRTACFEATDSPAISALPQPYGHWLAVQENRPRWKEKIDLRLVLCARARLVARPDGRFDALADIALSGPAITLMEELGMVLDRPPMPLGAARWLTRPTIDAFAERRPRARPHDEGTRRPRSA